MDKYRQEEHGHDAVEEQVARYTVGRITLFAILTRAIIDSSSVHPRELNRTFYRKRASI
jgi:hypothetical protein